jgi:hypothetical protein
MRSLRLSLLPLPFLVLAVSVSAQSPADKAWIARSNTFTQRLIDIDSRYLPEEASAQGLSKFDTKIADPSLASVRDRRKEEEAVVQKLIAARKEEKDPNVAEDLDILIAAEQRAFRQQDFALNSTVEYINATSFIYRSTTRLPKIAASPRPSASSATPASTPTPQPIVAPKCLTWVATPQPTPASPTACTATTRSSPSSSAAPPSR